MKELPMRAACTLAAVAVAALGPAIGPREASATQIDVAAILRDNRPVQRGVDYDTPTDPAEVAACKAEPITRSSVVNGKPQSVNNGVLIRDGQGRALRRFVDASGNGQIDMWCFYKDGFEVYRDVDYNDDRKIDESRWLNTAGTRIAVVEGGKIARWRRLSAQEASQVLVQAMVAGDLDLLASVMASPEELSGLGLPSGMVEQARAEAGRRRAEVEALTKKLAGWGWTNSTAWLRFDADMPHLIPSDASSTLKDDVVLFENAVVFAGQPDDLESIGQVAYLQVPEMVKLGEVWKFVGLPRAFHPDPSKAEVIAAFDGIRSWLYRESGASSPQVSPEMEDALRALAEYDAGAVEVFGTGDARAIAQYYRDRIERLRKVIAAASASERPEFEEEVVNSLALAYQTGEYPAGKEALQRFVAAGGPLASHAAFRLIPAEFTLRLRDGGDAAEAQKGWVADLERFLKDYGSSKEVPEALFQLASIREFNGEDQGARELYQRLTKDHASTGSGRKAAGALRRLDLVGKTLELSGPGLDGETIDVASARGKHLLVVFGAGSSAPTREILPELVRLADRRKADGLEVIGVALDGDVEAARASLEEVAVPWRTIVEPGGMESRLAEQFGIISLPTMFLVDPQGVVLNRDVRTTAEVENELDGAMAKKTTEGE